MSSVTRIAIAVVERDGRYLVGLRTKQQTLAGKAEFPGGKVEANETFEAAAIRECLEETGLEIEIVSHLDSVEWDYDHGRIALEFILCRVGSQQEPRPPFRWVAGNELPNLDWPDANQTVIQKL
ncbi:(deoxy)nucleoside triphosphate pyrophosphohydrolase [Stratiformator vulcanicus]|uniref:8-oxo-dGTP diphosphatase n=1 Tax=Stratiformator vulcanicus TaxID=2527980 RepID=A0A517QVN7_9PLAN|nr:(deoxy)nucleoside triphosphate pyrophosphohydrolase [Stratiformator vulcanicus]QDT35670.1 8-oxo-dGTP diphosphatase [Stratiformator vulcanicus]